MKILITGGRGQLGRELCQEGQACGFDTLAPSRRQLDITDYETAKNFIQLHHPAWVINAAGYTQVDKAENEESLAFAVNKTGCANMAHVCAKSRIPLLQLSTDYVYNGDKKRPYLESDPVSPIGVYGRSKAAGETEIRTILKQHIILRTSWLYGVYGRNFFKTILKLADTQKNIRVISDQYGSPTSADDLAKAIFTIVDRCRRQSAVAWGTYHYCGQGIVSWCEFAQTIIELARQHGEHKTSRVEPVATADYPTQAKRPAFSALDCNLIQKNFGITPKPWRQSLKATIQRFFDKTASI